jgi:hypothetical protein
MIYLISSCTNVKSITSNDKHLLRNYDFSSLEESSTNWKKNLSSNNLDKITARKLYQGPSWKTTLDVEKNFSIKFTTQLLIASAGHGLIDSNEIICSYGSTFSKGHKDSIHHFKHTKNPTQQWWCKTNHFNINSFNTKSYLFIFLPSDYLIALKDFIEDLIDIFDKKIYILSTSKNKLSNKIENKSLRFDTRFNSYEKGTLITLSQRCMRWLSNEIITKELPFDHQILQSHIDMFLSELTPYTIEQRKQLKDDELIEIITNQIKTENIKSATQGLKNLRMKGFASEQKRYGKLFNTALKDNS